MANYDDFLSGYDPDSAAGIPQEFTQRTTLGEAITIANNIHRELVDQVDGMLADYVRHAALVASHAAAMLLTTHPKDDREVFELQKRAAPYAFVMEWIREKLIDGANAQQQLNELDSQEEQRDE